MFHIFPVAVAYAEGAAPAQASPGAGLLSMLPMIVIFFVIFYFLVIRPQSKQQKQHKEMLQNLQRGDHVLTRGGVFGRIFAVEEHAFVVEIAEGVRVKVLKNAIADKKAPE